MILKPVILSMRMLLEGTGAGSAQGPLEPTRPSDAQMCAHLCLVPPNALGASLHCSSCVIAVGPERHPLGCWARPEGMATVLTIWNLSLEDEK